jgi:2-dehydropantoate 2-reductase
LSLVGEEALGRMRIAVLGGAGAMGGIFGGWLKRSGSEVVLVDVAKDAVRAINEAGLSIDEKDGGQSHVRVRASDDPKSVGQVDLIINFVKCYHTEAAIEAAKPMLGPETAVLTLQNGWGNADRIGGIVGRDRVLVGLTYHSGTLLGPGRVKHPGVGLTYLGELDGRDTARLQRVAASLRAAGFETTVTPKILDEVWKKLALNACTLPTAALLRFFAHELESYDGAKEVMAAILREVVAVAKAQGMALDYDERWEAIVSLLRRAVGAKPSMLQDVEASRRTEIEVINGAIVRAGKSAGIPTPVNETMVAMIGALQAKYLAVRA